MTPCHNNSVCRKGKVLLTKQKKEHILRLLSNITKQLKEWFDMSKSNTVTCSFTMDREIYNAYKSIVCKKGENVKGNLVRYMMSVIHYETPNADTIAAIEEVQKLKAEPDKKSYESFAQLLGDLNDE